MVNVIDENLNLISQRKDLEDRVNVAKNLFPEADVRIGGDSYFFIDFFRKGIFLNKKIGQIYVTPISSFSEFWIDDKRVFEQGMTLAKEYEQRYGSEVTIRKKYK